MNAGIKVVNLNSLVKSNNVTSKIYQSDIAFGQICADFIVNKLNGKGNILVLNGIAGSEISNERWIGAENVFKEYPDIHILYTATISVTALNTLIDALKGKKVSQEIELPIDTITSENIYDYYRSDLNDNFWCDTQLSDANLKKLYQRDEES